MPSSSSSRPRLSRLSRLISACALALAVAACASAQDQEEEGADEESGSDALSNPNGSRDRYQTFAELRANEREGTDYEIVARDRSSPLLVLAIHGGRIEMGTTELAKDIAEAPAGGDAASYYSFVGIKPSDNFSLHITSRRFDEPRALELAGRSQRCVSVHGFPDAEASRICLGGLDEKLKAEITRKLAASLPDVTVEAGGERCGAYVGVERENIVNRCERAGAQLEMSSKLRKAFLADDALRAKLATAIRSAAEAVADDD